MSVVGSQQHMKLLSEACKLESCSDLGMNKNAWDQHKSRVQRQGMLKYYSEAQQHTRSKNEAKELMYDVSEAN